MRDLRYAVRVLRRSPIFTLTAVLTLALCVGVNTASYTVVDRVLLRPLPYPRPDRLALVVREYRSNNVSEDESGQAGVTWEALRRDAGALAFAATSGLASSANFVAGERAVSVKQQRISTGYFRVLGVTPALGREFTRDEDRPNGPAATILSHALWMHAFNGDRSIVGRAVMLRGEPHTVVGVMPASLVTPIRADLWTPLRPSATGEGGGENYEIIARIRDGVSWAQADAQVAAATDAIVRDRYRRDVGAARIGIVPLQRGEAEDIRQPMLLLWAAVGLVLAIGCVNVAGLLIARGRQRAPEIAMRLALGGSRSAIVRQLLAESLVIAGCGGVLGLAIGAMVLRASTTLLAEAFGMTGPFGVDARVVAICAAAALSTSVVFGLLPALRAARVDLRRTLVESGSTSIAGAAGHWPRRLMVLSEVALGVVLLVGAGLLIRSFDHLMAARAGFDGTHVTTATLSLQDARYRRADRVHQLVDASIARLHEIPGVDGAAVALTLPYERALNVGGRWVGAEPGREAIGIMNLTYVSPEYFATLRVPIVRGRVFTAADADGAEPVIVVNQAFVSRYSPDRDPIGRQIASSGTRTIVGIVGDVQQKRSWGNAGPIVAAPASYIPAAQTADAMLATVHTWFSPSWFVRTSGPQPGVVDQMTRALQTVDPLLPVAKVR